MSTQKLNWVSFTEYFSPHHHLSFESIFHELVIDFKMHKITLNHNDKERQHPILELERHQTFIFQWRRITKFLKSLIKIIRREFISTI